MSQIEDYHIIEDNILFSMSSDSAVVKLNADKNSRMVFNIPNMIHQLPNITDIFFSINSAVIPASFYNINSTNNKWKVGSINYTITQGNYNINDLISAMTNAMISVSVVPSYNLITNKVTLTNGNASSLPITFNVSPLLWMLGFPNTGSVNMSALVGTATSTNCVNLINIPRLFIRSSAIDAGNYSDETESQDVLAVIPNTACFGGVIHYVNYNGIKHLVESQNLSSFDIFITDDERNEIDFNGVPVFFTINITLRKEVIKPPTFDKVFNRASSQLENYNSLKELQKQKIYLN